MSMGLKKPVFDWSDKSFLPSTWQEAFSSKDFYVDCGGVQHKIRWTPSAGATSNNHNGAERVVAALGKFKPLCERAVDIINSGTLSGQLLGDGRYSFTISNRSVLDLAEREALLALGECSEAKDLCVRANKHSAIEYLVEDAFSFWFPKTGIPLGEEFFLEVNVVSMDLEPDLVGMMAAVDPGVSTRAFIAVNDGWFENVLQRGLIRDGQFYLGENSDGHVYSTFGLTGSPGIRQLIGCWGTLYSKERSLKQDLDLLVETASFPTKKENKNFVYVCSHSVWDYNNGRYFLEEGSEPACVVFTEREAEAWRLIANFRETYVHVMDLRKYLEVMWETTYPEGFDPETDEDGAKLLSACVRSGLDPSHYALPTAVYSRVPFLRRPQS